MFVERFYNPEKLLRARLSKNPVYPFTTVEPNVYVVFSSPKQYITACVVCAVALLAIILLCTVGRMHGVSLQYVVIPILMFLFFMPQMFVIRGVRTLVLDFNQLSYEVCIMRGYKIIESSFESSFELLDLSTK